MYIFLPKYITQTCAIEKMKNSLNFYMYIVNFPTNKKKKKENSTTLKKKSHARHIIAKFSKKKKN